MRFSVGGFVGRWKRGRRILRASALAVLAAASTLVDAAGFEPGVLEEEVVCAVDPEQSYALYLPSAYTSDRRWPVLYLFDARSRGAAMARHHQAAAERLGWIVVSSNNSESDGEFEPNRRAMIAMWEDSHARFPIDPRRRYAAGFSGGGRVAVILGQVRKGEVAGVIGWGAGFPIQFRPVTERPPFAYFAAVGDADFNYSEMIELERQLDAVGARHRLRVFDGGHDWPPPDVAAEALTWMEIEAMKRGLRPVDLSLVETAFAEREAAAIRREEEGEIVAAAAERRALVRDFTGFHDVTAAEMRAAALEASEAWSAGKAAHTAALDWEAETFERIKQAFNATAATAPVRLELDEVLTVVDVEGLRARAAADSEGALAARRMLSRLTGQTAFMLPRLMSAQGDHRRALLMLEIGVRLLPESAPTWLRLAETAMRAGDPQRALDGLEEAVANGLEELSVFRDDPLWEPVRGNPRFVRLISGG